MLVSRRPDAGVAQSTRVQPCASSGPAGIQFAPRTWPGSRRSATSTSTSTATTRYPPLQIFTDAQREGLSGFPARFDPEVLTASSR